jgi:flavin-dependent dehydrogenase
MRRPKVIVIGGGPSGGACALELSRGARFEVIVVDKSVYPRVKVCGSGLSPHALRMLDHLGLRDRFAPRHCAIEKMTLRGPDGGELEFDAGIEAWVVPRVELDHGIVQAAVASGAQFSEGTKVLSLLRDAAGMVLGVQTEDQQIEADLVVCADGSPSRFSLDKRPKTTIHTLMGWWRGTPWGDHSAQMVWDRRLAGYYAWRFPEPGGVVNIGLTIPEHAPEGERLKELFQALLDEYWGEGLRGAEQIGKWMGHPAVISRSVGKVAESRALWVGEAARLVSPGTVEGISFALESGITGGTLYRRALRPAHRALAARVRGLPRADRRERAAEVLGRGGRRAGGSLTAGPLDRRTRGSRTIGTLDQQHGAGGVRRPTQVVLIPRCSAAPTCDGAALRGPTLRRAR